MRSAAASAREPAALHRRLVVPADRRQAAVERRPARCRSAPRSGRRWRTPSRCRCPSCRRRRWRPSRPVARRCPCRRPGTFATARSAKNAWMSALRLLGPRRSSKNSSRSRRQPFVERQRGRGFDRVDAARGACWCRRILRGQLVRGRHHGRQRPSRAAACRCARASSGAARRGRRPRAANATAPGTRSPRRCGR